MPTDEEFERLMRGDRPFDLLDNVSNILGHFMDGSEKMKKKIIQNLIHAGEKIASEIGVRGNVLEIIDTKAPEKILAAAQKAEAYAREFYTDKEQNLAFLSDIFSCVAAILYGNLGRYREDETSQSVCEMIVQLYVAAEQTYGDRPQLQSKR